MKKWSIGIVVALAVVTPRPAVAFEPGCQGGSPTNFPCQRAIVAKERPTTFTIDMSGAEGIAMVIEVNGRQFLTGDINNRCNAFGRYGDLRVREHQCINVNDDMRVTVRSVGAPIPLIYHYSMFR